MPTADVVLGVGKTLMGDDGLGIAVVALLRARYPETESLQIVDGGTWGMNLLHIIEGARRLMIVDAIDQGRPPGTRIELEREELPRYFAIKLSPHQLDLREVLGLAELRGNLPEDTFAIGVQPEHVGLSLDLSPTVAAKLPGLLSDIEEELARWGHHPLETRAVHA
jgi:hydrogenase maturation protease